MSEVKAVQVSCTIAGATRKVDRSASIRLATSMEATSELMAWLDDHHQQHVDVLIAEDRTVEPQPLTRKSPANGQQSPSQRLRSAIWGRWSMGFEDCEFDEYYEQEMEKLIKRYR